jgi:tyrosinase
VTAKPSDPRGWLLQAFIHGDCDGFTHCQHGNWFFAPWHRSFLYYFERLIQHFSGDQNFALPYWDWSRTPGVPASFYASGNPLDDVLSIRSSCSSAPTAGRGRSVTDRFSSSDLNTYVGSSVVNRIQQNPDYATYGGDSTGAGELERTPHNFIHRWVGGAKSSNMVQFFSPLDPIFWMHHCNIDRLYSNWLARPKHVPPADTTWQKTSFNDFFDQDGKPPAASSRAARRGLERDGIRLRRDHGDAEQAHRGATALQRERGDHRLRHSLEGDEAGGCIYVRQRCRSDI